MATENYFRALLISHGSVLIFFKGIINTMLMICPPSRVYDGHTGSICQKSLSGLYRTHIDLEGEGLMQNGRGALLIGNVQ